MSNHQYQQQQRREQRRREAAPGEGPRRCPSCGTVAEPGDAFCGECGEALAPGQALYMQDEAHQHKHERGNTCPHCAKPINATCELCPHCGKPVSDDYCTFCGQPYESDEQFCMECGSARGGIKCPKCGTLSFRSFCCHCNEPLNDNALQALEQARHDPKFQRAQQLQQEMESMEAYLQAFAEEIEQAIADEALEGGGPDIPSLSKEGEALQAKYAELMGLLGQKQVARPAATPTPQRALKRRQQMKIKFADAEVIMAAYKAKAAEMQATLASMMPEPGMTPQMQRDYACARKVAIKTSRQERRRTVWECNLCHCLHNQPAECAEPKLGGTWHYETVTVTDKVWKYMD